MPAAHHIEPLLRGRFAQADFLPYGLREYFAAAAGDGVQPRCDQTTHDCFELRLPDVVGQRVALARQCDRKIVNLEDRNKLDKFRRRKRVQVHLRETTFQILQQLLIKLNWQVGVHPTLHQYLRAADVNQLLHLLV